VHYTTKALEKMWAAMLIALVLVQGLSCRVDGGTMQAANGSDETGIFNAIPTYASRSPRIDGKISELTWANVPRLGNFRLVGSGDAAAQSTYVQICYDKTAIYFAFECRDERMDRARAEYALDGEPVWQDDSIEIYISPHSVADASNCHHFAVNLLGAKTCQQPGWAKPEGKWQAAAVKMKDRWAVEVAIPFEMIRPLGKNEPFWRINLCRNQISLGELSSWAPVPLKYATFSKFGRLIAPDEASFKFNTYRGAPEMLKPAADAPAGAQAVTEPEPAKKNNFIIPEPMEVHQRRSREPFHIKSDTRIIVNDNAAESDLWSADQINEAIRRLGGGSLAVVRSSVAGIDFTHVSNAIVIGETTRNELLNSICRRDSLFLPRSARGNGSYAMNVSPERVVICGSSAPDTFYGIQTFKQLLSKDADGAIYMPSITVRDTPRFGFRGVHLLASRDALSHIGKLITNVLAPLKINNIVLQIDNIDWKSHPEIVDRDRCMPREDIPKLLEIARRHHITVTPLVQCPGHVSYILRAPEHQALAEDPNTPYCYCMSNPKSYELIYSLFDEAIELFGQPEYVHAGHDEYDMRGVMPYDDQCKAIGKHKLYVEHIRKVYDYLKSRGCKMMIWGDLLSRMDYRDLLDRVPKDIVINDWRYSPALEYSSVDVYQSRGFTVIGCTWYDPRNIALFSDYADKRRIAGMMQTTWTGWEEEDVVLAQQPRQLYAYILGAAWAWNPTRPALDMLPYRPDVIFKKMWYPDQPCKQPEYKVIRLDRHCNISRADSARSIGWLGLGHGNDLRGIPDGVQWMDSVPYLVLPAEVDCPSVIMLGGRGMPEEFPKSITGIEVNTRFSTIHFLHGCAHGAEDGSKAGSYVVKYEDGEVEQIDLAYSREISAWYDQSTALTYGFAWREKIRGGALIGVSELSWDNPRPKVKVTSIDFVAHHPEASPFLVAMTTEE
jgi:hypothetical protein